MKTPKFKSGDFIIIEYCDSFGKLNWCNECIGHILKVNHVYTEDVIIITGINYEMQYIVGNKEKFRKPTDRELFLYYTHGIRKVK